MVTSLTPQSIVEALTPLLRSQLGSAVCISACERLTAGASAATWRLTLSQSEGVQALILRLDVGEESFGASVGKQAEAMTQQVAFEAGVPVAPVLMTFDQHPVIGNGYLMECIEGESLAPRILREDRFQQARDRLTRQCAESLARIHMIETSKVSHLPVKDALTQLQELKQFHQGFGESLPVFSLAFRWLERHAPPHHEPTLVHGDFRLGNFLVDESGLTGILDWELTHQGDPLEDLGWLCVRAWRFSKPDNEVGGFGRRTELLEAYQQIRGVQVNPDHVLYWELFGTLKWGVICQYQAYSHLRGHAPSLERAAIGRRVAETEYDMLMLLDTLL